MDTPNVNPTEPERLEERLAALEAWVERLGRLGMLMDETADRADGTAAQATTRLDALEQRLAALEQRVEGLMSRQGRR